MVSSGQPRQVAHFKSCKSADVHGLIVPACALPVQVGCGYNLTVALTSDGRVFQMGATGAYNPEEKKAAWEGATVPTQVRPWG